MGEGPGSRTKGQKATIEHVAQAAQLLLLRPLNALQQVTATPFGFAVRGSTGHRAG